MIGSFKSAQTLRVMEYLSAAPEGATVEMMTQEIDALANSLSKTLQRMVEYGHVKAVKEPRHQARRRCRYYLPCHEETALEAHAREDGITWSAKLVREWPKMAKIRTNPDDETPPFVHRLRPAGRYRVFVPPGAVRTVFELAAVDDGG